MKRLLLPLLLALAYVRPAAAAGPFDGWTYNGTAVAGNQVHLAPSTSLTCEQTAVDGGSTTFDPASGLCHASDPGQYTGGDFLFGTITSSVVEASFTELVGSWDAVTPPGTWIELHARALQQPGWSSWYSLGVWSDGSPRHSVTGQQDDWASVDTDTLKTTASAYQLEVTLFTVDAATSPTVRLVHAATTPLQSPSEDLHSGVELNVPQRSQMLPQYRGLGFGGGGEAWCSPTSTSMVMAYWAKVLHLPQLDVSVPAAAAATYDRAYRGAGNWPFNAAFAGSYGLTAYVERFGSLEQVEPWIRAGVPIVISVSFAPGQLAGAPIPSSPGHLIVVKGFTADGSPIVNDPAAATDDGVRTVYDRAQLERVWQRGSHRTAYVIYPPGWQLPTA